MLLSDMLQTVIDDAFSKMMIIKLHSAYLCISNIYIKTNCLDGCKNSWHMQVSIIINYWHVQKKNIFIPINVFYNMFTPIPESM